MWSLMARLVGVKELRKLTLIFVISAVAQGLTLTLMIPFLRSFLGNREGLSAWLIAILLAGFATLALGTYGMIASYKISVYEVCDTLIRRIADRVLKLPLGWFDAATEAAVASAVSREINTLSHVASIVIPALCNAFVVPAVMTISIFFVDWKLALILILTIGPLTWVWKLMKRVSNESHEASTRAGVKTAGRLIEFARLQPVLRATGVASRGWEPLERELGEENETIHHALRVVGRPAMLFTLVVQAAFSLVLATGLSSVLGGGLDAIGYLAIMTVCARMVTPLSVSILYSDEVHNSEVALRAVARIVESQPLPEPTAEEAVTAPPSRDIEFADVTFGYEPHRPVVEAINLRVGSGKITALVGPSGAGKSTLLRLIARFWDVDGGSVSIGGIDVRKIPTESLMSMMSMVFQEVFLFDTTIRENVRMARPNATEAELNEAARRARLDRVIEALPDGWDTEVGQGGLKLSGGERQRVSIARAFLKDAPILLLDEITSALDGENEAAITEVMRELARGRTVVVVAHRLSTIRDADHVAFLEPMADGGGPARIVQFGSPQELASQEGPFTDFLRASMQL